MAIQRNLDVQWGSNWWISLGFHLDHTDPSLTLHLPGIVICLGNCKQPGLTHSLHRRLTTGDAKASNLGTFSTSIVGTAIVDENGQMVGINITSTNKATMPPGAPKPISENEDE